MGWRIAGRNGGGLGQTLQGSRICIRPRIRGQTPAALGQTLPHILPHILRQTLIFRG
ncbi:Uncharacterised protein [Neisseria meningitidis]|nr:Uncharacterised protein [Neisseria meningitidis]